MQKVFAMFLFEFDYGLPTTDDIETKLLKLTCQRIKYVVCNFFSIFFPSTLFFHFIVCVCSIRIYFCFPLFRIFRLFFLTVSLLLFLLFFDFRFVRFVHIHRTILSSSPFLILECSLLMSQ